MNQSVRSRVCGILWFFVLLAADQLTKLAASLDLEGAGAREVIPGVFELLYLENRGAAFGILRGRGVFFVVIALVITLAAAYTYCRAPAGRRYLLLRIVCVLTAAGACGNMIDRVCRGYVIDFFYVSLIDFPVFNVADCYVTAGVALLFAAMFTCYREESFSFLLPSRRTPSEKP